MLSRGYGDNDDDSDDDSDGDSDDEEAKPTRKVPPTATPALTRAAQGFVGSRGAFAGRRDEKFSLAQELDSIANQLL